MLRQIMMRLARSGGPMCGVSMLALLAFSGCQTYQVARTMYQTPSPPAPLGVLSDEIWRAQEENGEISDFVLYQHEFRYNDPRLNLAGQDHLKQIAMRLRCGQDLPVVIERSMTAIDPDSEFKFPIHPNPELDNQRRELVARALLAMGIHDAECRVLVSEPYSDGMDAAEAAQIYEQGVRTGGGYGHWGYPSFGGGGFGPFSGWNGYGW